MTLPQYIADAVKSQDQSAKDSPYDESAWQTIRAHLLSQDAEIERLQSIALAVQDERIRADIAESRLAAADALLRDIDSDGETVLLDEYYQRIREHLQGAGDEA